jgi:hypothetical protein
MAPGRTFIFARVMTIAPITMMAESGMLGSAAQTIAESALISLAAIAEVDSQ